MPKGGVLCLLIFRIMDQEISMKIKRQTDYFSIFVFYTMFEEEKERGNKSI